MPMGSVMLVRIELQQRALVALGVCGVGTR